MDAAELITTIADREGMCAEAISIAGKLNENIVRNRNFSREK